MSSVYMQSHRRMPAWAIPLLLVVIVIGTPLWIPAIIIRQTVHKHRLRKAANSFACVRCGSILGVDALKRADTRWAEYLLELSRKHPGVKFRTVRTLHAICLNCGTRYTFCESERTFVVEEPGLPVG
jgi:hypothetical protein